MQNLKKSFKSILKCLFHDSGNCCIKYSACSDDVSSFSLDLQQTAAKHDAECVTATQDFVQIIGSSLTCRSNNLVNRYCGAKFNPFTGADQNAVVCGKFMGN